MKPKTLARQTAELIAAELFRIIGRGKAIRLKLEFQDDRMDGLGWCESAVADSVEKILSRRHLKKGVVVK